MLSALDLLLCACFAWSAPSHALAAPVRVPLLRKHGGYNKHLSRRKATSVAAANALDAGFWYGTFDVGQAANLSLMIDTGSKDLAVNPHIYKLSASGQSLNRTSSAHYWTTETNGCGEANIAFDVYTDLVSMSGFHARNHTIASVIETGPAANGTRTSYPHDGICGFGSASDQADRVGGVSFFQSLCDAHLVPECRFGLALGTSGNGQQLLGGLDAALFDGPLSFSHSAELWRVEGAVGIGNSTIYSPIILNIDSGAANMIGPIDQVRRLYELAGVEVQEIQAPGCARVVTGIYNCTNPPDVGFSINQGQNFLTCEQDAFRLSNTDDGRCVAALVGMDTQIWTLGQAFFQGKYIDFNFDTSSIGVARLVNASGSTCEEFNCLFPNAVSVCD